MAKLEIVKDSEGNKIVLIPEILFFNEKSNPPAMLGRIE